MDLSRVIGRHLSRRRFLQVAGASAAAIAARSPGHASARDSVARTVASPKRGGELRLGIDADVANLDTTQVSDNESLWTSLLIFNQLTRPTADGLSTEANLARGWDISKDLLTYTFHLQPGVKFHDGSPLTADDVKYCIDRLAQTLGGGNFSAALSGTQVLDPLTFRMHLSQPYAPLLSDLSSENGAIYPKKLHLQLGAKFFTHPIGTGPFMFSSWQLGSQMVLKRNPDWWRNPAQPYVDTFYNMVVPDPNARVLQVQSGELDIALFPPLAQAKALQSNPAFTVHVDRLLDSYFATMNVTKPPLNNKLVRQALNYAVDKDAIVQHVLFGFGQPTGQALPIMFGYDPSIQPYPYDPAKAKALLAQAGYPHGFDLPMMVNTSQEAFSQVGTIMQQSFGQIGVNTSIQLLPPAAAAAAVNSFNYHIRPAYMTGDTTDPDGLVYFAMVGSKEGCCHADRSLYVNPTILKLEQKAGATTNRAERQRLFYQMERIHHDDAPFVFLYTAPSVTVTSSKVQGFKVLPTGCYRLEEAWIE
jgi:peptide/nickel transport system substrate-binding protein